MSDLMDTFRPTFTRGDTFLGTDNKSPDAAITVAGIPFDIDGLDPSVACIAGRRAAS